MATRAASKRSASRKASSAIADDARGAPLSAVVLTDSPTRARSPARPPAATGAAAPKAASYAAAAATQTAAQTAAGAQTTAHAAAAPAMAAVPVLDNAQLAGAVNTLMAMVTRLERTLEERTRPPAAAAAAAAPSEAEAKSLMASLPSPAGADAPSLSSAAALQAHGSSTIPPPSAAAPSSDLIDVMRGSLAHAPAAVRGSAVAPPGGIKDEHDSDSDDYEEKLKRAADDHHRGMGAVLSPGGAHAPTARIYRGPRMLVEMQVNHRSFTAWHRTYTWNVPSIQKQAAPLCRMLDAFVASYGDKVAFTPGFEIGACRLSALQAVDMGEWTWEQATHLEVPDPAVSIASLEHQQDALRRLALVNKAKPPSQAKSASGGGGGSGGVGGGGKRKQGGRGSRSRGNRGGGGGGKNAKGGGGASTSDSAAAAKQ
jgi:hypothetical protein